MQRMPELLQRLARVKSAWRTVVRASWNQRWLRASNRLKRRRQTRRRQSSQQLWSLRQSPRLAPCRQLQQPALRARSTLRRLAMLPRQKTTISYRPPCHLPTRRRHPSTSRGLTRVVKNHANRNGLLVRSRGTEPSPLQTRIWHYMRASCARKKLYLRLDHPAKCCSIHLVHRHGADVSFRGNAVMKIDWPNLLI